MLQLCSTCLKKLNKKKNYRTITATSRFGSKKDYIFCSPICILAGIELIKADAM